MGHNESIIHLRDFLAKTTVAFDVSDQDANLRYYKQYIYETVIPGRAWI